MYTHCVILQLKASTTPTGFRALQHTDPEAIPTRLLHDHNYKLFHTFRYSFPMCRFVDGCFSPIGSRILPLASDVLASDKLGHPRDSHGYRVVLQLSLSPSIGALRMAKGGLARQACRRRENASCHFDATRKRIRVLHRLSFFFFFFSFSDKRAAASRFLSTLDECHRPRRRTVAVESRVRDNGAREKKKRKKEKRRLLLRILWDPGCEHWKA